MILSIDARSRTACKAPKIVIKWQKREPKIFLEARKYFLKTRINHGEIISEGKRFFADLLIENGKIVKIAPHIEETADTVIDASGCYVMPGFIDTHTHFDLDLGEGRGEQLQLRIPYGGLRVERCAHRGDPAHDRAGRDLV